MRRIGFAAGLEPLSRLNDNLNQYFLSCPGLRVLGSGFRAKALGLQGLGFASNATRAGCIGLSQNYPSTP